MTGYFVSRFIIYFATIVLPLFHPAIEVPYDRTGWILWFFLIPSELIVSYLLAPPRFKIRTWILAGLAPLAIAIAVGSGFTAASLEYTIAALIAFATTAAHFRLRRGKMLASLEVFLPALIMYRLLTFTRGSEDLSAESGGLVQILLFLAIGLFAIHCFVLYRASYVPKSDARDRREMALLAIPLALLILGAFLLPPDFVEHNVVINTLNDEIDPELIRLNESAEGMPDGNLRGNEQAEDGQDGDNGEDQGEQGGNRLEGIPSSSWEDAQGAEGESDQTGENGSESDSEGDGQGQSQGPQRTYAVMIVGSDEESVYAAEEYRGTFDPVAGFGESPSEPLNELTFRRFIETWINPFPALAAKRQDKEVFFLSTIPDRVLPYEPITVEPTILDRRYHPFSYSYKSSSAISVANQYDWVTVPDLTDSEREELSEYLEIPLSEEIQGPLLNHLNSVVGGEDRYYGKIAAILKNYETYQYNIGFTEDVSVSHTSRFLLESKEGDCTEFSNGAALLGRLAGIPSRVVTGYLASDGLQTRAHREGIQVLREQIPRLQSMPEEYLKLVTSNQRHSWVQYYLPGFGWVDFETTSNAIPPIGSMDPNNMNVVIPILQDAGETISGKPFPWQFLLIIIGGVLAAGVVGAYSMRYGREIVLTVRARGTGTSALKALFSLLLMRFASEGHPIKQSSQTANEYADIRPEVKPFADSYTALRYRERLEGDEERAERNRLAREYRQAIKESRRRGIAGWFRRVFSLRGLKY